MKAKKLLFHFALLIGFILLGCSTDDAGSGSNSASLTPQAPSGNKNQTFAQGATVGNIVVSGENIKWYKLDYILLDNPANIGDDYFVSPENSANRILLDPQTVLRDKNVYFATQTVNNIESSEYLSVAVRIVSDH